MVFEVRKPVAGLNNALPKSAAVVGTIGIGEDLEAVTGMTFEQLDNQVPDDVVAKVGREISKSDRRRTRIGLAVEPLLTRLEVAGGPVLGTAQLLFRVGRSRESEEIERRQRSTLCTDGFRDLLQG